MTDKTISGKVAPMVYENIKELVKNGKYTTISNFVNIAARTLLANEGCIDRKASKEAIKLIEQQLGLDK